MKRFHLHIRVDNLDDSIAFYQQLFHQAPSKQKADYAKWEIDDPAINLAISSHSGKSGIDHIGIQVDNDEELVAIQERAKGMGDMTKQENIHCCYANSDKYWLLDPQKLAWEFFVNLSDHPTFGGGCASSGDGCCAPSDTSCCNA